MTKQTNDETTMKPEKKRTGPVKAKEQVTVRIDSQLMAEVQALMKEDDVRITELIEEGLILVMKQRRHELPAWTKQVRFITANLTTDQTEPVRGLAIAMVENEIQPRSEEAEMFFAFCDQFLRSRNLLPHANECLKLYARYGKREEERTK